MRLLAFALILLAIAPAPPQNRYLVAWAMESNVYPGDRAGHDFLAVFQIGDGPNFGRLVAMVAVPTSSQMAHHADYAMPANHTLFTNDFMAARSYVFDLRNPLAPKIVSSFGAAGAYTHPHSFAHLSGGNVLATYQVRGPGNDATGALVELSGDGHVLKTSDASATDVDPNIRPYSLLVLEALDRVVTTSAAMTPLRTSGSSDVVQVWRLSDLTLLKTVVLPKPERFKGAAGKDADEAAVLSDGKTVLVKTSSCGLYRLNGLEGRNPNATFVYDFGYRSCSGVPVVAGNYWLEPALSGHCIISLDVRDTSHLVEAGHLYLGGDAIPHWMSLERGTGNFVITGFGSLLNEIWFASVDLSTGALKLDPRTIDFNRKWPDGWNGAAIPHAALFY